MTIHYRPPRTEGTPTRTPRERDIYMRGALRVCVRNINAEVEKCVARIEEIEAERDALVDHVLMLGASRRSLVDAGLILTARIKRAQAEQAQFVERMERASA